MKREERYYSVGLFTDSARRHARPPRHARHSCPHHWRESIRAPYRRARARAPARPLRRCALRPPLIAPARRSVPAPAAGRRPAARTRDTSHPSASRGTPCPRRRHGSGEHGGIGKRCTVYTIRHLARDPERLGSEREPRAAERGERDAQKGSAVHRPSMEDEGRDCIQCPDPSSAVESVSRDSLRGALAHCPASSARRHALRPPGSVPARVRPSRGPAPRGAIARLEPLRPVPCCVCFRCIDLASAALL